MPSVSASPEFDFNEDQMMAGIASYRAGRRTACKAKRLAMVQGELQGLKLAEELAAAALKLREQRAAQPNRRALVLQLVAEEFDVDVEDLKGRRYTRRYTLPRHVAMLLLQERLGLTKSLVAESFPDCSLECVVYGVSAARARCAQDANLASRVQSLGERVTAETGGRKPVASVRPAIAAERIA